MTSLSLFYVPRLLSLSLWGVSALLAGSRRLASCQGVGIPTLSGACRPHLAGARRLAAWQSGGIPTFRFLAPFPCIGGFGLVRHSGVLLGFAKLLGSILV
jgi:hypothetical protein